MNVCYFKFSCFHQFATVDGVLAAVTVLAISIHTVYIIGDWCWHCVVDLSWQLGLFFRVTASSTPLATCGILNYV